MCPRFRLRRRCLPLPPVASCCLPLLLPPAGARWRLLVLVSSISAPPPIASYCLPLLLLNLLSALARSSFLLSNVFERLLACSVKKVVHRASRAKRGERGTPFSLSSFLSNRQGAKQAERGERGTPFSLTSFLPSRQGVFPPTFQLRLQSCLKLSCQLGIARRARILLSVRGRCRYIS